MNRFAAIVMSSLILLTSLRDVATYAIFQLNQDYISQNLCENRFKPEVMCSGKCVLNKSLAQNHEQKEGKQTIPQQEERSVFVLPNIEIKLKSYSFLIVKKDSIAYCTAFYAFEFLDDVFHPPSVFS